MNKASAYIRTVAALAAALCLIQAQTYTAGAQNSRKETALLFKPMCDSIRSTFGIYLGNEKLEVNKAVSRDGTVDLYFNRVLSNYPLTKKDIGTVRSIASALLPQKYAGSRIGKIYTNDFELERYAVTAPGNDGNPSPLCTPVSGKHPEKPPVTRLGLPYKVTKGLQGRNIALWQSHGYYYEKSLDRWEWQRARIFQTVEDLYTQSYVIPYLVPMLENAGAYIFMPRERDINTNEFIADNSDRRHFRTEGQTRPAGKGFGPRKRYLQGENPFECGDAVTVSGSATWTADIPEDGQYAVYVSYRSLPQSTDEAIYSVSHLGGTTSFSVNQKIGGGTWIYLGTFPFAKDGHASVHLTRREGDKGALTADAVKFGGGYGSVARGGIPSVSGYPRWCEGARYWLQYAGYPEEVYSPNEKHDDYRDDFMSRGLWVDALTAGSSVNPGKPGKGVPVDLALGFHSDAGTFPNDSIIGTLAIHTVRSEGSQRYPSGEDRITSRQLAHCVQTQIVEDIRAQWEPMWSRRSLWDRSYFEARTPPVPSMLLELLSHQNLADMRYGLDPGFRFTVSRAVYKGILKYLAGRYGTGYVVQPLPVKEFSATFTSSGCGTVLLNWQPQTDELEPTAVPDGYIVYTRTDRGPWDEGRPCTGTSMKVNISKGRLYEFKVVAVNEGGAGFPSEILGAGVPKDHSSAGAVLVVNGFDRVAPPAHFATADTTMGGFLNRRDSGVPYIRDISFTGEQYEFDRRKPWLDDDNPGFGASGYAYEDRVIAGNTFSYPAVHGRAIMAAGRPFCSCSRDAFGQARKSGDFKVVDLILGKQVTTPLGRGAMGTHYRCFPAPLREALSEHAAGGGDIIVSGAYIATDIWDSVYDGIPVDSAYRAEAGEFAQKILGYKHLTNFTASSGDLYGRGVLSGVRASFAVTPGEDAYCTESPDGLSAAKGAVTIMSYGGNNVPAAVLLRRKDGCTAAFGFPLETIGDEEDLEMIFSLILGCF